MQRRAGKLSAIDFALLDSIYFAVSGLAEGYALLGKHGWIDEDKRAFHPVVETIVKLQRELKDDLARLGLHEPPKPLSITDCPICGKSYFGECRCAIPSTVPANVQPVAEDDAGQAIPTPSDGSAVESVDRKPEGPNSQSVSSSPPPMIESEAIQPREQS
jgi:hypothetical protein